MDIPKDSYILLSLINTKLRDEQINIDEFCKKENIDQKEIEKRLLEIGYKYDNTNRQFKN